MGTAVATATPDRSQKRPAGGPGKAENKPLFYDG